LFGASGAGEKRLDAGGELVGTLDLRHVTDAGEKVRLGVRE
jgi:hypothetical protein